uniref:Uncharacterized protein n=1 Tax=Chromera velia CCMP2878 TaxID=1169474 RepID=A0A0G4GVQ0_9ALVE|eukprot:Cvel_5290.t1-p1 / transcript=Cvel_5290.t1 / gene=Cvel_5290 / organism=Chromera_velia_CCMP2878 / gene_product=hypothetical protein / transcript_product=hypothetical protein / location=Cvel_scaffold244:91137-97709(-) / protein_length=219 / sequence_SO=supercontig / SO=protein_coding / is_pseudo=false
MDSNPPQGAAATVMSKIAGTWGGEPPEGGYEVTRSGARKIAKRWMCGPGLGTARQHGRRNTNQRQHARSQEGGHSDAGVASQNSTKEFIEEEGAELETQQEGVVATVAAGESAATFQADSAGSNIVLAFPEEKPRVPFQSIEIHNNIPDPEALYGHLLGDGKVLCRMSPDSICKRTLPVALGDNNNLTSTNEKPLSSSTEKKQTAMVHEDDEGRTGIQT